MVKLAKSTSRARNESLARRLRGAFKKSWFTYADAVQLLGPDSQTAVGALLVSELQLRHLESRRVVELEYRWSDR